VRVRLDLQQRAATNLRRHALRAVRRFAVLVVADLASFYVMRELVRVVRDYAWFGERIATRLGSVLPAGILNGWQYAAALFVALFLTRNYGRGDQRRDPQRLFIACALATALPLWMTLWTRGLEPVILQYSITTVLVWAGLLAERRLLDRIVSRVLPYPSQAAATLFVGPADECREAMKSQAFAGGEYCGVGFVDSHLPPAADARGHVADFPRLLHEANAEAVVVCGYLSDSRFGDVVDAALAAQCQLLSAPRAIDVAGVAPKVMWRGGQPVIELTTPSLKGWQLALKRVTDVIGSTLALVLAAPVMAVIAAAIKFDSHGPVLFTQDRVGFGGRRFRMIKFRTMRNGADGEKQALAHLNHTGDPRLFKIPNDPRVTKLGAMLRRWSLDELPQLWNVFVGDMALVGPRPFFEADLHTYEDRHFRRLGAKPGITGLWQVRGRSSVVDFEEVVELDREYIEHWTVWSDLQILALTPGAVLRRRGAY
jgi:exopolysaccharide biosynthesis polyprenyl glycosylphosphotransferase